ncbi:MAG: GTP cyclohydrolase IIa [Conexivisphaera sp.]
MSTSAMGELGLIEDFLRGKLGIKVGVGRGRTAKEALSMAAEGLDGIRRSRPRKGNAQP